MQFQMLVKCGLTSPHRATGEVFVNASLKGHFDFYDPKSFERHKYSHHKPLQKLLTRNNFTRENLAKVKMCLC